MVDIVGICGGKVKCPALILFENIMHIRTLEQLMSGGSESATSASSSTSTISSALVNSNLALVEARA